MRGRNVGRSGLSAAFLSIAAIIRALPPIRGKVRLGRALYRLANPLNQSFVLDTTLYAGSLRFRLDLRSAHELMAFLMDEYESSTVEMLLLLSRGAVICDVGANIGLITVPLAAALRTRVSSAPIVAIEPMIGNHDVLSANVRANGLDDTVTVLSAAAGSSDAEVLIQIEGDDPTLTGTANILPATSEATTTRLVTRTLDSLRAAGTIPAHVDTIKIDTDGYDLEVLRGATTMLREDRPFVVAEFNAHCMGWHGQTLADVDSLANEHQYSLWLPEHYDSQRFHRYRDGEVNEGDCLLLPIEEADRVVNAINEHLGSAERLARGSSAR